MTMAGRNLVGTSVAELGRSHISYFGPIGTSSAPRADISEMRIDVRFQPDPDIRRNSVRLVCKSSAAICAEKEVIFFESVFFPAMRAFLNLLVDGG